MKTKKILQNVILVYLLCNGLVMNVHVIFKLVVRRAYEVDIMFWITIGISLVVALSSLIFSSRESLTLTQVKRRLFIHGIFFLASAAILYSTDFFQFSKAAHPLLEGLLSYSIAVCGYIGVVFLVFQRCKNNILTGEMNKALKRYQEKRDSVKGGAV